MPKPGILEKWGLEGASPEEIDDVFNEKMYFFGPDDVDGKPTLDGVSAYQTERHFLKKLIKGIYDKNQEEFKDKDAVFDVFVKAAMTESGVISLARLIDKTFGERSFCRLKGIRPKTADAFFVSGEK